MKWKQVLAGALVGVVTGDWFLTNYGLMGGHEDWAEFWMFLTTPFLFVPSIIGGVIGAVGLTALTLGLVKLFSHRREASDLDGGEESVSNSGCLRFATALLGGAIGGTLITFLVLIVAFSPLQQGGW